jgi:TatD DNase family protein
MILTDTHTHIYLPDLSADIENIMQRAREKNITRFFLPNIDTDSIEQVLDLSKKYPGECYPMMGLHPCSVKEDYQSQLVKIQEVISVNKIYAIGEIGIDLYWDKTFLKEQQDAFHQQIQWSKKLDLPIVIHCRDAFDEVYEILISEKDEKLRGIFHCFTGNAEQAKKITDLDFYLGIGGVLTYKNSGLDNVVKDIDLGHLVLETDSPYLTPVPYRGKRNESAYLWYVAKKLAEIKGTTIEAIADITTDNSKKIFNI